MQREWFGPALGSAILALTLAGYGATGRSAPYLLLPLVLIAMPYLVWVTRHRRITTDSANIAFATVFVLIVSAFALSARDPVDLLSGVNFLWLLLFIPQQGLLGRLAGPSAAVTMARLALLGVVLMLAIGLYEKVVLGFHRIGYLSSDAIRFPNTAVVLGFVALSGVISDIGWRRTIYVVGPLCALAIALLAGTRGAFLSTCLLAVLAAAIVVTDKRQAALAAIALVTAAVFFVAIGWYFKLGRINLLVDAVVEIFRGVDISIDSSSSVRLEMFKAAWSAFLDRPVFGHSWNNMMEAIRPHLTLGNENIADRQSQLHSDLANFAVSSGVVGLTAYGILLAAPPVIAWRSNRDSLYRPRLFAAVMLSAAYFSLGLNTIMFGFEIPTALYCTLSAAILGYCRERSSYDVWSSKESAVAQLGTTTKG